MLTWAAIVARIVLQELLSRFGLWKVVDESRTSTALDHLFKGPLSL